MPVREGRVAFEHADQRVRGGRNGVDWTSDRRSRFGVRRPRTAECRESNFGGAGPWYRLGGDPVGVPVYASVGDALDDVDVLVDYTSDEAVRTHTLAALERGVSVVIGTPGLSARDFADIDRAATEAAVGSRGGRHFSLTAAMAQAAALLVDATSPTGRSSTTPRPASLTLPVERRVSWLNAWRTCERTGRMCCLIRRAGRLRLAGRRWTAPRSTHSGCPVSSYPPRFSSRSRTNDYRFVTTPGTPPRRTSAARCWLCAQSLVAPASHAGWTASSSRTDRTLRGGRRSTTNRTTAARGESFSNRRVLVMCVPVESCLRVRHAHTRG